MSKENNLTDFLTDLGSAIKEKRGTGNPINAQDYASEVRAIEPLLDTLVIGKNGTYDVKNYKNTEVIVLSDSDVMLKNYIERTLDDFVVPYGVTKIGVGVFDNNKVSWGTPSGQKLISKFYLPTTIETISQETFSNSSSVYFNGTLEEWGNIEKGKTSDTSYQGIIYTTSTSANYIFLYFLHNDTYTSFNNYGNVTLSTNLLKLGAFSHINFMGKEVTITKNVTELKEAMFYRTNNLKKLIFEAECVYENLPKFCCMYMTTCEEIILPKVKTINPFACSYSEFKNVVLKEGLEEIGQSAFGACKKIQSVNLPSTLKTIGVSAFIQSGLQNIYIPSSVESIGNTAFGNISNLKVVMESSTPCTLGTGVFNTSGLKIFVPKGTSNIYKSATNWSSYANYIYEEYSVVLNTPSALLNNDTITYSIDGGKTYQMFTSESLTLDEVGVIKIKSTDSSQVVKVGTSAGANDVGTISNSELTFSFTTDTSVYLTIQ